ncbi:TlpA family protein disulfide reductase [Tamlana fucoidanivorans]|uniref:TlpA family protein disulfide reductase n=1 Tax=Allotamlana fucoidanivorans TaxID=2583814 RepID=A0A5C4SQ27_9FLAO|nr:TlpA disulfide reductase family protein [Tamlana fucoidanivorans]TNJ45654.1 TlpA family protein disulfide reductase [Tamlana fucoidanivorans]
MRKVIYLLLALLSFSNCESQDKTKFSEAALNDTFVNLEGDTVVFKEVLNQHQGKLIIIDIWASWCGDCIKGMPKVRALQEAHPEAVYLFLSLDRGQDAWKRGIKKYRIQGEHYYLPNGKKSAFGDFVNIDWIPRYMVVDSEGNIKLFKAVEADNNQITEALL